MENAEPHPRPASPSAHVAARATSSEDRGVGVTLTLTTRAAAERAVAEEVAALIRERGERGAVLGLATGGTMEGVYRQLVRLHREEGLSFAHVDTINLDEYLDLGPDDPRSFAHFMREHLFAHVDMDPKRAFVPDGRLARLEPERAAREVTERLERLGGLDLQLLGIGRNGHLAFNEPGASHASRARVVDLAPETREDAAASFGGLEAVPRRALTLGLGEILAARRLCVLAFGAAKADAVAAALEGPIGRSMPASALRLHDAAHLWVDSDAAARVRDGCSRSAPGGAPLG